MVFMKRFPPHIFDEAPKVLASLLLHIVGAILTVFIMTKLKVDLH